MDIQDAAAGAGGVSAEGIEWAWMAPVRGSRWHLVSRDEWGPVLVAKCGYPLCGQVDRVLTGSPQRGPLLEGEQRSVCTSCLTADDEIAPPDDDELVWPPEPAACG